MHACGRLIGIEGVRADDLEACTHEARFVQCADNSGSDIADAPKPKGPVDGRLALDRFGSGAPAFDGIRLAVDKRVERLLGFGTPGAEGFLSPDTRDRVVVVAQQIFRSTAFGE